MSSQSERAKNVFVVSVEGKEREVLAKTLENAHAFFNVEGEREEKPAF